MFTVDVVLPTPPFWFATTNTRVAAGLPTGSRWMPCRTSTECRASAASGV